MSRTGGAATVRGFTLIELLISMVVVAILGTILARMLVQDSRFVSKVEALMDARQSARQALHTMAVELRMVSDGGLVDASEKMIEVNVPFAWGLACDRSGAVTVASLLPADSMMYAAAIHDGLAWRDNTGNYNFVAGPIVNSSIQASECAEDNDSVRVVTGGRLVEITMPDVMPYAVPFYLYQRVRYRFAASVMMPGRTGLWRDLPSQSTTEELLAPFDTTAGFGYYVDPNAPPSATPPMDLTTVTALDLLLFGASEFNAQGSTQPEGFELRTRVTFLNKRI